MRSPWGWGLLVWLVGTGPIQAAPADLMGLYQKAVGRSPDVQIAEKQVDKTRHQEDGARAGYWPSLRGQAASSWARENQQRLGQIAPGQDYPEQTLDRHNIRWNVTLSQPLFQGWRTWAEIGIAEQAQEQARASLTLAKQELIVELANAYFEVLDALNRKRLAEQQLGRIEKHLERARTRYEKGVATITGVHEAEARLDQTRARLMEARNRVDIAKESLQSLIQGPVPTLKGVGRLDPALPTPQTAEGWYQQAVVEHPQIKELEAAIAEAEGEVTKVESRWWPNLQAQAVYSRTEQSEFYEYRSSRSVALVLDWAFWEGGRISSERSMAQMDVAQTRLRLDRERRAIKLRTLQQFKKLENAISRVESLRAVVRSQRTKLDSVTAEFERGHRTSVDVLDAQQELFDAQQRLAEARHEYLLMRLELGKAAGRLSLASLREVNGYLGR
jgi:outer membrane protein